MATQVHASPQYTWNTNRSGQASAGGIIGQIAAVFMRPVSFFQRMPYTGHWLFAALVILGVAGYASLNQTSTITQATTAVALATVQAPVANVNGVPSDVAAPANLPAASSGTNSNSAINGASSNLAPPAASSSGPAGTMGSTRAVQANSGTANIGGASRAVTPAKAPQVRGVGRVCAAVKRHDVINSTKSAEYILF